MIVPKFIYDELLRYKVSEAYLRGRKDALKHLILISEFYLNKDEAMKLRHFIDKYYNSIINK